MKKKRPRIVKIKQDDKPVYSTDLKPKPWNQKK
jgi:hypothetical protein